MTEPGSEYSSPILLVLCPAPFLPFFLHFPLVVGNVDSVIVIVSTIHRIDRRVAFVGLKLSKIDLTAAWITMLFLSFVLKFPSIGFRFDFFFSAVGLNISRLFLSLCLAFNSIS